MPPEEQNQAGDTAESRPAGASEPQNPESAAGQNQPQAPGGEGEHPPFHQDPRWQQKLEKEKNLEAALKEKEEILSRTQAELASLQTKKGEGGSEDLMSTINKLVAEGVENRLQNELGDVRQVTAREVVKRNLDITISDDQADLIVEAKKTWPGMSDAGALAQAMIDNPDKFAGIQIGGQVPQSAAGRTTRTLREAPQDGDSLSGLEKAARWGGPSPQQRKQAVIDKLKEINQQAPPTVQG